MNKFKALAVCALLCGTVSAKAVDMLCLSTGPEQVSKVKVTNLGVAEKMELSNPEMARSEDVFSGSVNLSMPSSKYVIAQSNGCDNMFTLSFDSTEYKDFERGLTQRLAGRLGYEWMNQDESTVKGEATLSCYRF